VEKIEGFPCLVMEYVDGGDLGDLLATGPLSARMAMEFGLHICDGMEHASRQLGLVHRDLKPSNCMVERDGQLKVTDFGLALAMREAQEESMGLSGAPSSVRVLYTTLAGTPTYMAPEQYTPGARLGSWTDVYAFGVMFYEMLTAAVPPPGGHAKQFIARSATSRTLPPRLRALVLRCVEPDPTRRPATFAEVRRDLELAYRELTGKPAPSAPHAGQTDAQTWLERSLAFYELQLLDDALAAAEHGIAMTPAGEDIRAGKLWHARGMALFRLGRVPDSVDAFDRALELNPQAESLWLCKSAALIRLGRLEESLACDDRALELAPDYATAWRYKAISLDRLGRLEEAHVAFERAVELHPRDSQLLSAWAHNRHKSGRLAESLELVGRALEVEPRHSNAWIVRGNTMSRLDRLEDALTCYDRVLEIDADDPVALIAKANVLSRLDRFEDADAVYERAAAMRPHDAPPDVKANLLIGWGVNLRLQGRLEEALRRTDQALDFTPEDSLVWANRAKILKMLGRHDEAVESGDRALSLDPDDRYALETRAWISAS
jgi:tetratricopeptide (TPR) repeat protein